MTTLAWAKEKSTYVITIAFTDEDDAAVVPTAATWTLSDTGGNIINSREDVAISPLTSSVQVVLTGADLALGSNDKGYRKFTIEATYDSSLGSGLTLTDEVTIPIENLVNVS